MPRLPLLALTCAGLALLAGPAAAQRPSFDCTRARVPSEHAICADGRLGALDSEMARAFRAAFAAEAGDAARTKLRTEQLHWLRWRNVCEGDRACLTRRYENRIADFRPGAAAPPQPAVEIRLRNGRWERVFPDGTIHWTAVNGGGSGTIHPDGSQSQTAFIQIPDADFPALPQDANPWAERVEGALHGVVIGMLRPEDHGAYDALNTGFGLSDKVFRHVDAIRVLGND